MTTGWFTDSRMRRFVLLSLLSAAAVVCSPGAQSDEPQRSQKSPPGAASDNRSPAVSQYTGPQYNDKGELKLPADFETWVFVGANLGLEYREAAAKDAPRENGAPKNAKPRTIHNVYINREAYEHYSKTGEFPDKTMLVLDIYQAEQSDPKSIVSEGLFPGQHQDIAVAVKNGARPDGLKTDWAYYDFPLNQTTAKAFPNRACYDCHLEHADDDNVWTQFYPALRKLRKNKGNR